MHSFVSYTLTLRCFTLSADVIMLWGFNAVTRLNIKLWLLDLLQCGFCECQNSNSLVSTVRNKCDYFNAGVYDDGHFDSSLLRFSGSGVTNDINGVTVPVRRAVTSHHWEETCTTPWHQRSRHQMISALMLLDTPMCSRLWPVNTSDDTVEEIKGELFTKKQHDYLIPQLKLIPLIRFLFHVQMWLQVIRAALQQECRH